MAPTQDRGGTAVGRYYGREDLVERTYTVPLIGGDSIDLDLSSGHTTTIVGPNGSGKSALSASIANRLSGQKN
ncbi:ATP-binding cassette domain-containing protein [Ornithinimicrobium flavum]|uniref:ATP-binding cassette domain-containing protein n=1 Tax=Ornithinimicrobium flavum TaxID=1288636 RepID=UPI003B835880